MRMETQTASQKVSSIDLSRVRERLITKEGMTPQSAGKAIAAYRRFLTSIVADPMHNGEPSSMADKAWHAHILFTRDYERDCALLTGSFIHHEPFDSTNRSLHSAKCGRAVCKNACQRCDRGPIRRVSTKEMREGSCKNPVHGKRLPAKSICVRTCSNAPSCCRGDQDWGDKATKDCIQTVSGGQA